MDTEQYRRFGIRNFLRSKSNLVGMYLFRSVVDSGFVVPEDVADTDFDNDSPAYEFRIYSSTCKLKIIT